MTTTDFIMLMFSLSMIGLCLLLWMTRKDAEFWRDCYKREADLHRKNLEHCNEVIIQLGRLNQVEKNLLQTEQPLFKMPHL